LDGNQGPQPVSAGSPMSRGRAAGSWLFFHLGDCSSGKYHNAGVRRSALAARQLGPGLQECLSALDRSIKTQKCPPPPAARCFRSCAGLWHLYIWQAARRDLKLRVAVACCLCLSKLVTIAVPSLNVGNHALTGDGESAGWPSEWLVWAFAARSDDTVHKEGREADGWCSPRGATASSPRSPERGTVGDAYRNLRAHAPLSLALISQRKTGGLTR